MIYQKLFAGETKHQCVINSGECDRPEHHKSFMASIQFVSRSATACSKTVLMLYVYFSRHPPLWGKVLNIKKGSLAKLKI